MLIKLHTMKKLLFSIITLTSGVLSVQAQITNYAAVPYSTGFESGTLDANWYTTASSTDGRIQIWDSNTLTWGGNTATAHTGTMWLGMDNSPGGTFVTTESWMGLDLAGTNNKRLQFWWSEWNEETHPQDGIYISDNGGTAFTKVLDLNGPSYTDLQWYQFDMSLDSINAVHGLSFTGTYVIKFQQHDNYYFAGGNDGFLIDDISVYTPCNTTSSINISQCTPYTVPSGDETYSVSGVYTDTIPNAALCDSIITVNLTINVTSSTINEFSCDTYTVPSGDETYSTSGTYSDTIPNTLGCDSLITINLTIGTSSSSTISPVACAAYTVPSGDETYTISGTYLDTIPNAVGCDSLLTINLTINQASTSTTTISECDSYVWTDGNTYTTSGMYTQVLTAANGCDSTATLDLTIGTTPSVTITSTDGVNLVANGAATTYTWIDCADSSVVGTGSTFIPSDNGDYAVIGDDNGCTDTSACFAVVSININEFTNSMVSIYPNPTKELLSINTNEVLAKIFVMDNSGRVVIEAANTTKQMDVSGLAKGRYILVLVNKQGAKVEKSFVKQ